MKTIKIVKLNDTDFDFENVPQGYIHVCVTNIPKPKGRCKFAHDGRHLLNPTDEQVIEYARLRMTQNDMYGTNSKENPEQFEFIIINEAVN